MNVLAPLFLLGLAAIALPIWLHRLQTQTPRRQKFSSAMLLEQAEQRVHVQKKLRYWLLLALRILLLALLALAFAKPVWERPPQVVAGVAAQLHLIVIDRSLSMAEGERMARARQLATQIIDDMDNADRAEIVLADEGLEVTAGPLSGAGEGRTALRQAIDGVQAGAGQLNLGAMMTGLEGLIASETQAVTAHLIGDFQETGLPAQFGDLVPRRVNGKTMTVQLHPVTEQNAENWSVESLQRTPAGVEVAVRGFHTPARDLSLSLSVNDVEKAKLTQHVPADGQAVFAFQAPPLNNGANRVVARLETQDRLATDDRYYAVVDNVAAEPVPLLTPDPKGLPTKYLAAAFAAAGGRYRAEPVNIGKFDARTLQRYPWIVIEDLGSVDDNLAKALREYLDAGGSILSALGERSLSLQRLPLTEQRVQSSPNLSGGEPLSIGSLNNNHPLLARTDGWRGINLTRLLNVETGGDDQVLIALDNGAPLLLQRRLGEGKLLLFTSSLDNTWNDLPVQPVFVSFIAEAAKYLSESDQLNRQQRVGNSLSLAEAGLTGQVIDPQGEKLLSLTDTQRAQSVKLTQPGFYQVYTQAGETAVAVNPDPRESDLAVISGEALQRWRDAAVQTAPAAAAAAASAAPEAAPLELWHALLALLAIIVLAESLLGNRYVFRGIDLPSRGLS